MNAREKSGSPIIEAKLRMLHPLSNDQWNGSSTLLWLGLIAIVLTGVRHLSALHEPLTFGSADASTMARSFARHGILSLGGVPVNNNDPLGLSPAVYIHWPPLVPALLGQVYRLFGESEATGHALMLFVLLATVFVFFRIAREVLPGNGAWFALVFYLTLPVVRGLSVDISQPTFSFLFWLLTLLFFLRATEGCDLHVLSSALACTALFLAVWCSWEPFWLPFALAIAAVLKGNRTELCLARLLCAVSVLAASLVALLYLLHAPQAIAGTLQTLKFRMGLSPIYDSPLDLHRHSSELPMGVLTMVKNLAILYPQMLGLLGIPAVVWVLVTAVRHPLRERAARLVTVFAGLLGPWFFWYGTMWNHVARHSFEMLLAAPGAAMAMAWCALRILDALRKVNAHKARQGIAAVTVVLPLLLMVPLAGSAIRHSVSWLSRSGASFRAPRFFRLNPDPYEPDSYMRFAVAVRSATPPNAIVFTTLDSMVPVYYSDRHIIRVVENDRHLEQLLPLAQAAFPGDPFFLALPTAALPLFPESILRSSLLSQTEDSCIYQLNKPQN